MSHIYSYLRSLNEGFFSSYANSPALLAVTTMAEETRRQLSVTDAEVTPT